jgi:DNA-binding MarR family transcriptional regulator
MFGTMTGMARPKPLDEDQRLLWKAYRDLYQGVAVCLQEQLMRDAGLSGSEYAVLVALSHARDRVLRPRDLCAELGWDRSRLSHLVRRMEERGLVTREECAEDARGSLVRLTDTGSALRSHPPLLLRRVVEGRARGPRSHVREAARQPRAREGVISG